MPWFSNPFRRKKRVLLHIGLPKCGSSSLQAVMANNAAANRALGICYPEMHRLEDGYRNHLPLAQMPVQDLTGALGHIATEARACPTLVLSCEHWTNALHNCNLAALCTALQNVMPDRNLEIIAYCRNPVDFVELCYAQFIRAGLMGVARPEFYADGAPSIERFLERFATARGYPLWSLMGWANAIRRETRDARLSLRSMHASDLRASNFIADFCDLAHAPRPMTPPQQNARLGNRKLAELEFAQTLTDNDSHMARRDQMIAHDFGHHRSGDQNRCTSLHIGAGTAEAIARTLTQERRDMACLFATRVDALCAMPDRDWTRGDLLTTADKEHIAAYVAAQHSGAA